MLAEEFFAVDSAGDPVFTTDMRQMFVDLVDLHMKVDEAEKMADALAKAGWQVSIRHRELERREKAPAPAADGLELASRAVRAQG